MATRNPAGVRPRVVVIGAGFGGIYAAKRLGSLPVDVTVVDRKNHHTFQPLLYQVALAVLSPGDIAQPIRSILRDCRNIEVLMDEAIGFDPAARRGTSQQRSRAALRLSGFWALDPRTATSARMSGRSWRPA